MTPEAHKCEDASQKHDSESGDEGRSVRAVLQ